MDSLLRQFQGFIRVKKKNWTFLNNTLAIHPITTGVKEVTTFTG
jgi:hypothetical protein